MTTITDVRTIAIDVRDQDTALAFYTDTLGFEKRLDASISETTRWIEVAPRGASTSIALTESDDAPTPVGTETGIRFTVPDAEAERDALQARGVAVGELLRWDDVPTMFTFDDPDGNRFVVVEAMG